MKYKIVIACSLSVLTGINPVSASEEMRIPWGATSRAVTEQLRQQQQRQQRTVGSKPLCILSKVGAVEPGLPADVALRTAVVIPIPSATDAAAGSDSEPAPVVVPVPILVAAQSPEPLALDSSPIPAAGSDRSSAVVAYPAPAVLGSGAASDGSAPAAADPTSADPTAADPARESAGPEMREEIGVERGEEEGLREVQVAVAPAPGEVLKLIKDLKNNAQTAAKKAKQAADAAAKAKSAAAAKTAAETAKQEAQSAAAAAAAAQAVTAAEGKDAERASKAAESAAESAARAEADWKKQEWFEEVQNTIAQKEKDAQKQPGAAVNQRMVKGRVEATWSSRTAEGSHQIMKVWDTITSRLQEVSVNLTYAPRYICTLATRTVEQREVKTRDVALFPEIAEGDQITAIGEPYSSEPDKGIHIIHTRHGDPRPNGFQIPYGYIKTRTHLHF